MKTINLREQIATRPDTRDRYCRWRENSPFFRRPRLRVEASIRKIPLDVTAERRKQNDVLVHDKTFRANIWVLDISNTALSRFSTTAVECSSTLHIRNLGSDVPLKWQKYPPEPKKCLVNEVPNEGESPTAPYFRLMPYYYAVVELAQRHAAPTSTIDVGEVFGLYFLFTYEGSRRAFIITPLEWPQWYGDNELFYPTSEHGMFLFINEGELREMKITFKSNQNQHVNHIKLRIKINSWDNVEIL